MTYFIAPYSKQFLGASRKIELLLGILSKIDSDIVLINSWVDDENTKDHLQIITDGNLINIQQYFLPTKSKNRLVYSLLNYVNLELIVNQTKGALGKPDMVWLYNCYFLETMLALKFKDNFNVQLIFEFEDGIFSRTRGINPKPYLDFLAWKKLIKKIDYSFAVNLSLANTIRANNKKVDLLPGLISSELVSITNKPENKPFSRGNERVKLGYFGGLSGEKGAKMLIDLFNSLSEKFEFVITGTGEMESEIKELAEKNANRFRYYGCVSNDELINLISEVDVFLNPHHPIAQMGNGIFPFKVMEAIASKRLILSTPLSDNDEFSETLEGIIFLKYSLEDWKYHIENAQRLYASKEVEINIASDKAISLFSEDAVFEKIKQIYKPK